MFPRTQYGRGRINFGRPTSASLLFHLFHLVHFVGGLAYGQVSSAFRPAGDGDAIPFGLTGNEIARALRTGILSPTCRLREDGRRSEQAGGE
jgi:hypothetical protein